MENRSSDNIQILLDHVISKVLCFLSKSMLSIQSEIMTDRHTNNFFFPILYRSVFIKFLQLTYTEVYIHFGCILTRRPETLQSDSNLKVINEQKNGF